MGFGLFRRRRVKEVTLEVVEEELLKMMESAKREIEPFVSEKERELRAEISSLISSLEGFDFDAVHPRLRNQARNFVSAMLTLWRDELGENPFHEASRRLEKTASLNVRYFRMLFAVNSVEIERINAQIRAIAGTVADVERKRNEAGIDGLEMAIGRIKKTKSLIGERDRISLELSELLSEVERIRGEAESGRDGSDHQHLAALRAEVEAVEREVVERENEVHRKIASVKKPLRIYAHAVGVRIGTDTRSLLLDVSELRTLASGALSEIRKGNIKVKEKRQEAVMRLLEEIAEGGLESEIEKIGELRRMLRALKSEVRKLESHCEKSNPAERMRALEKRIASLEEASNRLDAEIDESRKELENVLSGLLGFEVVLTDDAS